MEFRSIFGNEEESYADALKTYYEVGAPSDWHKSFISQYATHPIHGKIGQKHGRIICLSWIR